MKGKNLFNGMIQLLLPFFFAASVSWAETSFTVPEVEARWKQLEAVPISELKHLAESGEAVAKAVYYFKTVMEQPKDPERWELAGKWLRESSDAGVPHSMQSYAWSVREDDPDQYYTLLKRAADAGLPAAQFDLAEEQLEGKRAPVDRLKAVEWMQRAVDAGHPRAFEPLADMYASGVGEPRHSEETPFELYRKGAMHGEGSAMLKLARRYRFGYGTKKDLLEAARWYWRAAQRGHSEYPRLLSPNFDPVETGDIEDTLFSTLYSSYVKANTLREPETMRQVGIAFLNGKHGAPNRLTGYFWLSFSARRGDAKAKELASAAKEKLTKDEVSMVDREVDQMIRGQR